MPKRMPSCPIKKIDLFGRPVNLRYQGEDKFKTNCGAVATIVMGLTLLVIFIVNVNDIAKGKIASFNYMIRNSHTTMHKKKNHRQSLQQEIFGFGLEKKFVKENLIKFETKFSQFRQSVPLAKRLYNCTEMVLREVDDTTKKSINKDIKVFCLNLTTVELLEEVVPSITIRECEGKKCMEKKSRKKLLENLKVWVFTKADATDFTSKSSKLKSKFFMKEVSCSHKLFKQSNILLRELDINTRHGVLMPRMRRQLTSQFVRQDEQLINVDSTDSRLLQISMQMDTNSEVIINKEYQSLSHLLSFIGGLSRGLALLFMACVFPVREVLYYQNLINSMFSVCLDEDQVDLAFKMMLHGQEPEGLQDDSDPGGSETGESERTKAADKAGKKGKQIERVERKRRRQKTRIRKLKFLKEMMKREEVVMAKKGLMDGIVEQGLTADRFLENLRNNLEDGVDRKKLGDILMAGMDMKKRFKDKYEKEEWVRNQRGRDKKGNFVELDEFDKNLLRNAEIVNLGIERWKMIGKQKTLKKEIQEVKKSRQQNSFRNLMMQLNSSRSIQPQSQHLATQSFNKLSQSKRPSIFKQKLYSENPSELAPPRRSTPISRLVSPSSKSQEVDNIKKYNMKSEYEDPIDYDPQKRIRFRTSYKSPEGLENLKNLREKNFLKNSQRNPNAAGGGNSPTKNLQKIKENENIRQNAENLLTTERGPILSQSDQEDPNEASEQNLNNSQNQKNPIIHKKLSDKPENMNKTSTGFFGFVGKMKIGLSKGLKKGIKSGFGIKTGLKKFKKFAMKAGRITLQKTVKDRFQIFKENQKMLMEKSKELQFYTYCLDYIKLYLPSSLTNYTKRDLYLQVKTTLISGIGQRNDPKQDGNGHFDQIPKRAGKAQTVVIRRQPTLPVRAHPQTVPDRPEADCRRRERGRRGFGK